jgi:hypothetical protein
MWPPGVPPEGWNTGSVEAVSPDTSHPCDDAVKSNSTSVRSCSDDSACRPIRPATSAAARAIGIAVDIKIHRKPRTDLDDRFGVSN